MELKTYKIFMRKQWWIDSGIAGLYNIMQQLGLMQKYNIEVRVENNGLLFLYTDDKDLKALLKESYEELVSGYWNVSTKKQKENPQNVFFDPDTTEFYLRPKTDPTPIPKLFVKGSSRRLPDENSGIYATDLKSELQKQLDLFLKENNVKLWGKKNIILIKDPVCHKELEFFPVEKKKKQVCSICGRQTSNCSSVSQPVYLLFASDTATKSFNSQCASPDKVCWECDMLGRFAVEAANYRKRNDELYIIEVVSPDLKKMIQVNNQIGYSSYMRQLDEDNFFCNIRMLDKSPLYFSKYLYEFLWAFYYQAYGIIKEQMDISQSKLLDELLEISLSIAPIQIVLMGISDKGQTFITKDLVYYNDTAYIFRLMFLMYDNHVDTKAVFNSLYVKDEKDKYSRFRNRFFWKILNGKSVLLETENFAFRTSLKEQVYLNELINFIKIYEQEIGGISMNSDQVEVAINLGKSIVMQASEILQPEEMKKIKGDLFALRKTRTKSEFLSQINTLQMRYGLVTSKLLGEGILEQVPFEEFKAYCVLGALNVYNSMTKTKKNEGGNK